MQNEVKNLAQYTFIEKEINELKYGMVQLTIRVDDTFITDVVIHKAKRSLFKRNKQGNIEAKEQEIPFDKDDK